MARGKTSKGKRIKLPPPAPPSGPPRGSCTHHNVALARVLAALFKQTFLASIPKCHSLLLKMAQDGLVNDLVRHGVSTGTPKSILAFVNSDKFKRDILVGLKAAGDIGGLVFSTTADQLIERLCELVGDSNQHAPDHQHRQPLDDSKDPDRFTPPCPCVLTSYTTTLREVHAALSAADHQAILAPASIKPLQSAPLKTFIAESLQSGALPKALDGAAEGWENWPATIHKITTVACQRFLQVVSDNGFDDPFELPSVKRYLELIAQADGMRLYNLAAVRYELGTLIPGKDDEHQEAEFILRLASPSVDESVMKQYLRVLEGKEPIPSISAMKSIAAQPTAVKGKQKDSQNKTGKSPTPVQRALSSADAAYAALNKAEIAYAKGLYTEALEHYTTSDELSQTEDSLIGIANTCTHLGFFPEAESACLRAIQRNKDSFRAFFRLAVARKAMGQTTQAMQDLKRALETNPESEADRIELEKLRKELAVLSEKRNLNIDSPPPSTSAPYASGSSSRIPAVTKSTKSTTIFTESVRTKTDVKGKGRAVSKGKGKARAVSEDEDE